MRPCSLTVYNSQDGKIYVGACIAHELAHAYREKMLNIRRPHKLPEALLEESQTCIDASVIFYDKLIHYERVSLIREAKIRLEQWLRATDY